MPKTIAKPRYKFRCISTWKMVMQGVLTPSSGSRVHFSYCSQPLSQPLHCERCCMAHVGTSVLAPKLQTHLQKNSHLLATLCTWLPGTWCGLWRMELGEMPTEGRQVKGFLGGTYKVLGIWIQKVRWGSSHCGSGVTNLTSIHKDTGSIPGLIQVSGLRIQHCRELWCRSQRQLRSWVAVAVL